MKKVGILTLHYSNNYGGLLQCFALISFLKDSGYYPLIINRLPNKKSGLLRKILLPIFNFFFANTFKRFQRRYLLPKTDLVSTSTDLKLTILKEEVEAIIVGSDQVWRLDYTNVDFDYFIDFKEKSIKKISYAASFGTAEWKDKKERNRVSFLLNDFDFISCRERSGVSICERTFGLNKVCLVLDPTMLFDKKFYLDYVNEKMKDKYENRIVAYFLDKNQTKMNFVKRVSKSSSVSYVDIYTHLTLSNILRSVFNICKTLKNVEVLDWLSAIYYSKIVITDSFHGMVFSILFGKPFVVIGNQERGIDRFVSLLDIVGLQERLLDIKELSKGEVLLSKPIDYQFVYKEIERNRQISKDFLLDALA